MEVLLLTLHELVLFNKRFIKTINVQRELQNDDHSGCSEIVITFVNCMISVQYAKGINEMKKECDTQGVKEEQRNTHVLQMSLT